MEKIASGTAMAVAVVSLTISLAGGISIFTSVIRSGMVFVGVLFVFFLAGILMRLGVYIMTPRNPIIYTKESENE